MAYPIENNIATTANPASVTSLTVDLSSLNYVDNDVIFIVVSNAGNSNLSESGGTWTNVVNSNQSPSTDVYYKIASGTVANPTFNSTASNDMYATAFVVRDADTTTVINQSTISRYNGLFYGDAASVTTTSPDCLLIHIAASWNLGRYSVAEPMCFNLARGNNGGEVNHNIVWGQKSVADATVAQRFQTFGTLSSAVQGITIAVNNKSGGIVPGALSKKPVQTIHPTFAIGAGGSYSTNSATDRNDPSITTLYPTLQSGTITTTTSTVSPGATLDGYSA